MNNNLKNLNMPSMTKIKKKVKKEIRNCRNAVIANTTIFVLKHMWNKQKKEETTEAKE